MKKTCPALFVLLIVNIKAVAQVKVTNLICENKIFQWGLSSTQPRLSWQLISLERNIIQTTYEVKVLPIPLQLRLEEKPFEEQRLKIL